MPRLILILLLLIGISDIVSPGMSQPQTTLERQQSLDQASTDLNEATRLTAQVIKLHGEARYDEALALAKRVLELRQRNLSPDDEQIGTSALNIAEIYLAKKAFADSREYYQQALAIYEKKFGPDSKKVASVLARLAVVNFNRSNYSESESAFKRVLSIHEGLGIESTETALALHKLAEFYRFRGKANQAEPLYDRALMILRQNLPLDHQVTKRLLEHYSCLFYQTGRLDKLRGLDQKYLPAGVIQNSEQASNRGSVLNGIALSLPKPTYTEEARKARAQGTVIIAVTIDETGRVIEAHDMCDANPVLAKPSIAAAFQARFSPTKLSGKPVKVTGIITYNFVKFSRLIEKLP